MQTTIDTPQSRLVDIKSRRHRLKADLVLTSVAFERSDAIHSLKVAYHATCVKGSVALRLNDLGQTVAYDAAMASGVTRIHSGKLPHRIHYIPQWAAHRRMRQVDIVRDLPYPVDKGTVSRWFKGALPSEAGLIGLAGLFHCEVNDLFRDPADDWLKRFFEGRRPEEIERIRATLEAAFPKQVA